MKSLFDYVKDCTLPSLSITIKTEKDEAIHRDFEHAFSVITSRTFYFNE